MKQRAGGFALILVIWALVLLTSLATGFALAIRHEIRVSGDMASIAQAEATATAALHATADRNLERMSKLMHSAIDQYVALHSTLTPEQKQQLVENLQKQRDRREIQSRARNLLPQLERPEQHGKIDDGDD